MSDQHPTGEDIARMLREQGPVEAPPDLADEVMRQVRAEPVARPRRRIRFHLPRPAVLAPAVGLAAVAGVVAAIALSGGPGTSSSAGGGTAAEASGSPNAPQALSDAHKSANGALSGTVGRFVIARDKWGTLARLGVARPSPTTLSQNGTATFGAVPYSPYTLTVSGDRLRQALVRLRALSAEQKQHSDGQTVIVILRRKP